MTATAWWDEVLTGGSGTLRLGRYDGERYVVLPRHEPRLVVSAANRAAIADAAERWTANRTNGAAALMAPKLASRIARFAPVWTVPEVDGLSLRDALSEVIGEEVDLSIAVGPPRVNRKPVVRCYVGEELVAFAKLGPDPHTAAMVENEAAWLTSFDDEPLTSARTPEVIHVGSFAGHPLLVTKPLDLRAPELRSAPDMPDAVLAELRERVDAGVNLGASPWWTRLVDELDSADSDESELIAKAVRTIEATPGFGELPWSAWHGDWSPWNVGTDRSGQTCVWDWERTALGAPDHLDVVHLHHHYGDGLAAARTALEERGVNDQQQSTLIGAYLLEMMCRHHAAGTADADTAAMDRAALSACVAELGVKGVS